MPRSICVIGVDPGKKTGIACLRVTGGFVRHETMECDQVDVVPYVEGLLKGTDLASVDVFIGVQRFTINRSTHKKTRQPAASEIVGVVQELGRKYNVTVDVQSASTAARFIDMTLRRLGIYTVSRGGHANDAMRHALLTLLVYRPEVMARVLGLGTIDT